MHYMNYKPGTIVSVFSQDAFHPMGISFWMEYDGIGLLMVLLTAFSIPLIFLANFNNANAQNAKLTSMVFLMQAGLFGVFLAADGILFYIFWEFTLIPVFLIIYWFGNGNNKILLKFFLYTLLGSLAMLLSLIWIKQYSPSFYYYDLVAVSLSDKQGFWIMAGFMLAFAIKIPLFPFHTWQPATYDAAPMPGTMLLSALMLKMALFGMIRWMVPLAPEGLACMQWIVLGLGILGILYGAGLAIKETNIKKLFAFASISHLGLIAAGLILFTASAVEASLIQIINHSILSIALFLVAEILISRYNTSDLRKMGGGAQKAPRFAFWYMVILLASVSVPFSAGFIGEFLLLREIANYDLVLGGVSALTLVFGAVYMIRAYQMPMSGNGENVNITDLAWNEWLVFFILGLLIVVFGLAPHLITDHLKESIEHIINISTI